MLLTLDRQKSRISTMPKSSRHTHQANCKSKSSKSKSTESVEWREHPTTTCLEFAIAYIIYIELSNTPAGPFRVFSHHSAKAQGYILQDHHSRWRQHPYQVCGEVGMVLVSVLAMRAVGRIVDTLNIHVSSALYLAFHRTSST